MYEVILCTTPPHEAETIARALVEEKLVACVNVAEVSSLFRWEGKMEREKEMLLVMKTTQEKRDEVVLRINELHSYDVPEVIALPIIGGSESYLNWVGKSVE